jgi:hypothetical protein
MSGRALIAFALAAALAALPAAPGRAASWLEMNFYLSGPRYEGILPPCDYPDALTRISSRFNEKENAFWNSELRILGFENIREIAYRPWAANTMPRRFCRAMAAVTDGRLHTILYSIIEDAGMIGARWGVEWCVAGLDRNWAYSPACKMALP